MKHILLLLIFTISLTLGTCTENPVDGNDTKPGRRDYDWTVDTLFLPFNPFTDMTGTSPADLWVCSPGDADKIFYHYNGQNWKSDLIHRIFSPKSVSSIDVDNVWSGGRQGRIWNYQNGYWQENIKYSFNGITDITFEAIFARTTASIYATGQYFINQEYYGIILRYNGGIWENINIPQIRTALTDIKVSSNGNLYMLGVTNEQFAESRYQFYEFDGQSLSEIYSGSQSTDAENGGLLQLGAEIYFIIGYDFFSYNGNSFDEIGRLSDSPKFLNVGIGRNIKDIFLGMRDGVAHYNGENTVYLYQSTGDVFVRQGMVFENEVFFRGRDSNGNNLIFHGKLNE
ncbi:MAG: hypothetical protein PVF17_06350 [Ignavibacteria bacterium]|jgi:hypothetical protein